MSDTPSTDAVLDAAFTGDGPSLSIRQAVALASLARQFERQRNALDAALRERDKQLIAARAECDALKVRLTLERTGLLAELSKMRRLANAKIR